MVMHQRMFLEDVRKLDWDKEKLEGTQGSWLGSADESRHADPLPWQECSLVA